MMGMGEIGKTGAHTKTFSNHRTPRHKQLMISAFLCTVCCALCVCRYVEATVGKSDTIECVCCGCLNVRWHNFACILSSSIPTNVFNVTAAATIIIHSHALYLHTARTYTETHISEVISIPPS